MTKKEARTIWHNMAKEWLKADPEPQGFIAALAANERAVKTALCHAQGVVPLEEEPPPAVLRKVYEEVGDHVELGEEATLLLQQFQHAFPLLSASAKQAAAA